MVMRCEGIVAGDGEGSLTEVVELRVPNGGWVSYSGGVRNKGKRRALCARLVSSPSLSDVVSSQFSLSDEKLARGMMHFFLSAFCQNLFYAFVASLDDLGHMAHRRECCYRLAGSCYLGGTKIHQEG
ncbi:hypothetical protein E2542_SST09624 [Spatholobus suberectus]|nr:hypothetical protein E2542_SST09624 [Spatholobus suberectus]